MTVIATVNKTLSRMLISESLTHKSDARLMAEQATQHDYVNVGVASFEQETKKGYMKTNSKWKWLLLLSAVMGVVGCTDYYGTYQASGRPYYGGYGGYAYSQPAYGYGYPYAGYGYSSGYGYPYAGYGYSSGYGYPYVGYGYSSGYRYPYAGYGYRYGNQGYRYRSGNQGYYGNNQGYRYRSGNRGYYGNNQGYRYRSNQGYRYGGNRGYRYRNHRIQEEQSLPRRRGE